RANILRRDFEEMGIGIAEGMYKGELTTFTVQIFGTQRARIASAEAKSSKENMKQKSNLPGPVRVPENPAVATVSRDDAPAPPAPSAQKPSIEDSFSVDSAGPIQEKVKIL